LVEEKQNANERKWTQIKEKVTALVCCSAPQAHKIGICVYLRLFAFSFKSFVFNPG